MLELSPEAVGSGVASAAIMTTLCALVGRYALPRWIAAREKHEEESDARMSRLRERIDSVKADGIAAMNAMAERFHARIDSVNGLVGGLSVKTDRNERDIAGLGEIVREIGESAARLEGGMQGLTVAVQALTAAYTNGKKNGSA
jgi:hypothetical protein